MIQHWQTEEGLPQNSVTSIAQTPDGYLWLGTFNGLVRFDGVRFTVFDSSTTPELKSSRIVQTHVGRKGGLSILSEFQDFAAYSDGKFSSVAWATRPKANRCVKIIENSSGDTVVLDTERNIFRIRDFGIEWMASFTNLDLGRIVAMESDSSGKIWVALKKALGFVEAGNFIAWQTQLDPAVMLPEILGRSRSGIWFAGRHGGLSRVEGLAVKEAYAFPLAEVIPTVVCEDRQQQVWVGTLRDGLFLLRNGLWERISVEQGLSHESIRCVFEDREGNIWIGTDGGGLNRLRPRLFEVIDSRMGMATDVVLSVAPGKGGAIWMGLNVHGAARLRDQRLTEISQPPYVTRTSSVWSFCQAQDGSVWSSDDHGGLLSFSESTVQRMPNSLGRRAYVRVIFEAPDRSVWMGDLNGLVRFKDGVFKDFSLTNGLAGADVRALAVDTHGNLIVGTNGKGIAIQQDDRFVFHAEQQGLDDPRVWSLFVDRLGQIWVGTYGSGLRLLRDGRFHDVSARGGLPVKVVTSILEDDSGSLWIGSMQGIFQVLLEDFDRFLNTSHGPLRYRKFDRTDGLRTIECSGGSQPSSCKLPDGRLCFSTIKGLAIVDPSRIPTNSPPALPLIEEIVLEDIRRDLSTRSPLIVPPEIERFEIGYTGLHLASPEKVRFKYRLEGFDRVWVDANTRRTAYYSHVPRGQYIFRVNACNADGVWNDIPAQISIVLRPFFWQTAWFAMVASATCLAVAVWVVRRVFLAKLRHKLQFIEQQHSFEMERGRIARDIHDDSGARLTEITMLSELARRSNSPEEASKHLSRIASTTRQMVQAIDEIVWAVDPSKDTLDNLIHYVSAFAQEFLQLTGIRCRLDFPDHVPAVGISAETRHNIFLVVKEALNNAAKHSGATEVHTSLRYEAEVLTIEMVDNGQGFDRLQKAARISGNGLLNMKTRCEKIRGTCQIETTPGAGTTVRLCVGLRVPSRAD